MTDRTREEYRERRWLVEPVTGEGTDDSFCMIRVTVEVGPDGRTARMEIDLRSRRGKPFPEPGVTRVDSAFGLRIAEAVSMASVWMAETVGATDPASKS